ncbi:MAG: response regulator [Bdellovibrionaceae bacterium]|nr:response regulator [Pseudobdellovibrionaceae bacterium]
MALRVLLADESTTIKRVIQLALQDYAVEVRSVPVGLDVLPVAKTYKPDIVFADILLPKRSGYEVCGDLKNDSETQHIPVILMWSSFMELDANKAAFCQTDGRLEKPFETEQLRSLVQSLVPKLQTNPVSSFLKFPKLPEFTESRPPDESFQQIPLHRPHVETNPEHQANAEVNLKSQTTQDINHEESSWAKQDLNEFKLNIPLEEPQAEISLREFEPSYSSNFNTIELPSVEKSPHEISSEDSSFEEIVYETPRPSSTKTGPAVPSALDLVLTEKILREEAQKMLENMIWKLLPDIAERVVREEINKLLQENT